LSLVDEIMDLRPVLGFMEFIYGKLVGDRKYVGRNLFERLLVDNIRLIAKWKSNLKGILMSRSD